MTDEELKNKIAALAGLKTSFEEEKTKFNDATDDVQKMISELESEIKEEVLKRGESMKTEYMTVTWNKGRVSWNSKLLEGYAMAHPDILGARSIGDPTVSFKLLKK